MEFSVRQGIVLCLGAAALWGCGGPAVGDITSQEVTLTLQGMASAPDVAAIGEPAEGGLGVARVVVRASTITFEPCRKNVEGITLDPRAYELLQHPAPSETVTTAVQEWCGLQLDLEPNAFNRAEGVPEDATLYIEVTGESGETHTLTSEETTSLHFQTDAAASFGEQPLLLGFDVSRWLADVPLDTGSSEALAAQLKIAAALYVDTNGNGRLDDDEQTPLAEAEAEP